MFLVIIGKILIAADVLNYEGRDIAMTITKSKGFMRTLALILCIILCIPSMTAFAATDRTSNAFFNITLLQVGSDVLVDANAIPPVVIGDFSGTLNISAATTFELHATWGAANTSGWAENDYLIFDLPMSEIIGYPDSGSATHGDLAGGLGTWDIIKNVDKYQVKFTLSAAAVGGGSLDNGRFGTVQKIKDLGSEDTLGTITVLERSIPWSYKAPTGGGEPGPHNVTYPDLVKELWSNSNTLEGENALFGILINSESTQAHYEKKANDSITSGGSVKKMENVMVVDVFPEGMIFAGNPEEHFNFEMILRAPYKVPDTDKYPSEYRGKTVQSGASSDIIYISLSAYADIEIEQYPNESYSDFYNRIENSISTPVYGIYEGPYTENGENRNATAIILNLGELNGDDTFLNVYNRTAGVFSGKSAYTSMKDFLKYHMASQTRLLKEGESAEDAANRWITGASHDGSPANSYFSDNLNTWDYAISFRTKTTWSPWDLASKTLENTVTMKYGNDKSDVDSARVIHSRTYASIELKSGNIYLEKFDANDNTSLPGTIFSIQKYVGDETTLDNVRADTANIKWEEVATLTTTTGSKLVENMNDKFYKIVETKAADGYDKDTFKLYDMSQTELVGGIFAMPVTGIQLVATNARLTVAPPTPATETLKGTKKLEGRTLKAEEFKFHVLDKDNNNMVVSTGTNDASGNITFAPITYDKAGTYKYTVKEISGNELGMTYDANGYEVIVTVTEESGALETAVNYGNNPQLTFNNSYADPTPPPVATESDSAIIEGSKSLTGRDLVDGEFEFELYDSQNNRIRTATNQSGRFEFAPIVYGVDTLGSHRYTVKEANNGLAGVTYDSTTYNVTVHVSLGQSGEVETRVDYNNKTVVFNNDYTPPAALSTDLTLNGTKELSGRALQSGEFEFVVLDDDNVKVSTGTNDARGNIVFTPIEYDKYDGGQHIYIVREVDNRLPGITYDTNEYKVTVDVSVDSSGDVTSVVTYPRNSNGVSFSNIYTDPNTDTEPTPNPDPNPTPPTRPTPDPGSGGGGGGSDDDYPYPDTDPVPAPRPTPTPAPTPTPTPEPPYTPGGNDSSVPPLPSVPGNTLIPDGAGWIELDDAGVPLGRWEWDDPATTWIFDEDTPLAGLPVTGGDMPTSLLLLAGISFLGMGISLKLRISKH